MLPDFNLNGFLIPQNVTHEQSVLFVDDKLAQERERRRLLEEALVNREQEISEEAQARLSELEEQKKLEDEIEALQFKLTDFKLLPAIDDWIEANCYNWETVNQTTLDTRGAEKIKLTEKQKRILRHIFPPGGYGNSVSKYRRVIWSEPKKEGKTTIASCVVAYFAENVDPPNNILCMANKKDQAEGRIYRSVKATAKALGAHVPTGSTSKPVIRMKNGTEIKALPNSPATEAGDSYSLTAWSEIWAFKSEDDERLFAELMPVPTRRVSMQWVETYAGYWDESMTLKRLFLKAFTDQSEKALTQGAQFVEELADIRTDKRPSCVEIPKEKIFIYWSHENDAPWKDDDYLEVEEKSLTKVEAVRLLHNRWQSSSSDLLEPAWIEASVRERELDRFKGKTFTLAVDASQRWDNISLVGTFEELGIYYTPFIEIYDPKGQDADLEELIEKRVKALFDEGLLASYYDEDEERWITPVYFDPYQLHQIRLNCLEYGIDVIEFNQGAMRTLADTMLYHLYKDQLVVNPDRADFKEHLLGGKAKYLENEQLRIVKGTTKDSKKIDALVAQSMSFYGTFLCNKFRVTEDDASSFLAQGSSSGGWFDTE